MDFSSVPRALQSLQRRVPETADVVASLQQGEHGNNTADVWLEHLPTLTSSPFEDRWECLAVALLGATALLQQDHDLAVATTSTDVKKPAVYLEGPRVPTTTTDTATPAAATTTATTTPLTETQRLALCQWCHTTAVQHLEHSEPRIRTLVAKAVAVYATAAAMDAQAIELQNLLVDSIRQHLITGRDEKAAEHSKDSTGALDDTTGWRALETNWQTLAALCMARGTRILTTLDLHHDCAPQLWKDAEYCAVTHVNRHVRAASMAFLEQVIHAIDVDYETWHTALTDPAAPLHKCLAAVLKTGLADNWSQVRMAASVLCRVLFMTVQQHAEAQGVDWQTHHPLANLFPTLLPRMCLNRFYLAQGVKLYSHESWRLVMRDTGVQRVVQYLPAVCRYYVQAADADNHVVREAACQAMAELAVRLTQGGTSPEYADKLLPHVPTLLQALIMAFHDESWPVRDEACLATALLCKSFPDACHDELNTLWQRWTEQVTDQIWSVRQDAAVALGDALQAYPTELWPKIQALLKDLLPMAKQQPAMTREALKAHQNDIQAHTDSTLYSCGSLAPKLSKKAGAGRIGCSSCGVDREKAPWEATDGCIYLVRELVLRCYDETTHEPTALAETLGLTEPDKYFVPLLQQVVDVCRVKHFPQADDLRATFWRQLPVMAESAWGKDKFKKVYLHLFTDLLMDHLDMRTATALSKHAAAQCADILADLVGRGIFRGRLEDWQRDVFDAAMRERAQLPPGPTDEFSPYGPPGLLDGVGNGPTPTGVSMNPGRAF